MSQLEKMSIDSTVVEKVLKEFYTQAKQGGSLIGEGNRQLFGLLKEAIGEEQATELMSHLRSQRIKIKPFEAILQVDNNTLGSILHGEHPQTIALVLSHLNNEKVADILQNFAEERRLDIIERLLTIEEAPIDVMNQLSSIIASKVALFQDRSTIKRELGEKIKSVAEVLNLLGDFGEKVALKKLHEDYPEVAEQIEDHMFVFNDFLRLVPREIQQVLSQVNTKTIALALKGISEELRNHIVSCLSKRVRESVLEEKSSLGMVPMEEVNKCQREIIKIARNLSEAGKIKIRKAKSSADQMVE